MKRTLGDLMYHLAPFCDGGLCVDDVGGPLGANRVVLRINEAVERLSVKPGVNTRLKRCVRMCAHNGCVTCGRDIEKILKARVDGTFAHVFDKWYEFLEAGPGLLADGNTTGVDLVDRDYVVTQYDIPAPMRVMVLSDRAEDSEARMLIRGFDETGREVRTETNEGLIVGEYLRITRDYGMFTQNRFSMISSIKKPVTNGYVYLSAIHADDFSNPRELQREHLATYHPDDESPSFRRYAFKTSAYTSGKDIAYRINALVKMRLVPMTRSDDMCLIESMPAIKTMLQAMRHYDAGELERGQQYESAAEKLLIEDADDKENVEAIPDIQLQGFGLGDILNV